MPALGEGLGKPGPLFCLDPDSVFWQTVPMTDQEQRRIDAIARATIIGAPIMLHEGDGPVKWPWLARTIPEIYSLDPEYGIAMAQRTGLTSYLPLREQIRLSMQAIRARVVLFLSRWLP